MNRIQIQQIITLTLNDSEFKLAVIPEYCITPELVDVFDVWVWDKQCNDLSPFVLFAKPILKKFNEIKKIWSKRGCIFGIRMK